MKKLLGIVSMSLLLIFPLSINNSYSFFDTPIEKCMDRLEDEGIYIIAAAKLCNGGNNGSFACMKRLIKKDIYVIAAAKKCFGT